MIKSNTPALQFSFQGLQTVKAMNLNYAELQQTRTYLLQIAQCSQKCSQLHKVFSTPKKGTAK